MIQKILLTTKPFNQLLSLFFSDKTLDFNQITLIINDQIISDDENIAKIFNDFFSNVAKNLNLQVDESLRNQNVSLTEHPVLRALKRYENHLNRMGI